MKYNIILRNGRYALLEMETQYVVACGFDETQLRRFWERRYWFWGRLNANKRDIQSGKEINHERVIRW